MSIDLRGASTLVDDPFESRAAIELLSILSTRRVTGRTLQTPRKTREEGSISLISARSIKRARPGAEGGRTSSRATNRDEREGGGDGGGTRNMQRAHSTIYNVERILRARALLFPFFLFFIFLSLIPSFPLFSLAHATLDRA